MDNPQATRTLTTEDLAWMGGVIDGEGCIALSKQDKRQGNPKSHSIIYRPYIVISNSDPFFIEEVSAILKMAQIGHYVQWRKHQNPGNKRDVGAIVSTGQLRCEKALGVLFPYIRAKRDQAAVLSQFLARRKLIGKYAKNSYTEEDDALYKKLRELKRKSSENIRGNYVINP